MNYVKNYLKKTNDLSSKYNLNTNNQVLYHEKQVKELCALHTLNNLFQENLYTKTILDDICIQLSPEEFINPHRSVLGLGNYNINVIMKALQIKDYEAIWFDKRKSVTILNLNQIKGFILNVPSDYKIGGFIALPWKRKHWIAIARVNGVYYNMDSKLDSPELIGNHENLIKYLGDVINSKDKELFVIVTKDVDSNGTWRHINAS